MENFDVDNKTGINHEGPRPNSPLKFLTASSIMQDEVYNYKGEKLGSIKDMMIDLETGGIEYVIVEMGGFLGIGQKYFAIPFSMLNVDTRNQAFILDQEKETLEHAPGFDKDHWPQTNDHYKTARSYWGDFRGPNTGAVPY